MIAVLAVCVFGPVSIVYVLGYGAFVLLPAVGGMLGITLGMGVQPGLFTQPDKITVSIVAFCVSVYFCLLLYMTCWRKLEAFFANTPWLRHNERMQATEGGRKYATRCPFTGHRPTMRCPSCEARVHESAFHHGDRLVTLPVGETVLRWDGAKLATEQVGDPAKARRTMDKYLDFRGNTLIGTLTGCCTGCAHWQRCFNLLPRLSLGLVFSGMFFAFVPWAFASFLNGSGSSATPSGGSPIGGGGSKAIHVIADVLAVQYALGGLLVQIFALFRTNQFLDTYKHAIPSLKPHFRHPTSALVRRLLRAPWEQEA